MKFFYLVALCSCLMFAQDVSTAQDCDTPNENLIGNELDLGQRFCDSNAHVEKPIVQPKPQEPIDDEGLKKLEEFLNSVNCDVKAC